jgi:hypothetical protein
VDPVCSLAAKPMLDIGLAAALSEQPPEGRLSGSRIQRPTHVLRRIR